MSHQDLSLFCRTPDPISSPSPDISISNTPILPSSSISSPISFRSLTETRNALSGISCQQARDLIPMGKQNINRPPAPTDICVKHVLSGDNASKILLIASSETPLTAFKKLIDYGVQSAPVIDPTTDKCTGFLDIRDLVSLVVAMEEEAQSQLPSSRFASLSIKDSPALADTGSYSPRSMPLSSRPPSPLPMSRQHPSPPMGAASPPRPRLPASPRLARHMPAHAHTADDLFAHIPTSPPAHPPLPPSHLPPHPHPPGLLTAPAALPHALPPSIPLPPSASTHSLPSSLASAASNPPSPATPPATRPPSPSPALAAPLTTYLGQVFTPVRPELTVNTRQLDHKPQDYTVTYLAARNRCVCVDRHAPIMQVVELLATTQDVHRVMVVDGSGPDRRVVDIISQSDIVKLLHALFGRFLMSATHTHQGGRHNPPLAPAPTSADMSPVGGVDIPVGALAELRLSVDEANIGSSPVITVPQEQSMFVTLRMLSSHKISGAAVVDPNGAFVANTSGADLKIYLQAPHSDRLHQPVMAFIGDVRRAAGMAGAQTVAPAVSVRPCSSLLQVIAKLTATGMHRVFVCEPDTEKPLSVISVEDVVSMLHRGCPSRKLDRQLHRALSVGQLGEKSPLLANHPSNTSTGSLGGGNHNHT